MLALLFSCPCQTQQMIKQPLLLIKLDADFWWSSGMNLPASAGDLGCDPGLGRSHGHGATKPVCLQLLKSACPRACATTKGHHSEKRHTVTSSFHLPLEKACTWQ